MTEHISGSASAPEVAPIHRPQRDVAGILLLDKPLGLSSNRALQRVKWLFSARKAGHTGSLDPLATGMLPVCLGQATKISAFLLDSDKVYRVRLLFGSQTATGDAEGAVTATGPTEVGEDDLQRALGLFQGQIFQTPPMYSALKQQGQPLYRLARAGIEVPRSPRVVQIHELAVEEFGPQRPVLRVRCSKGTYIRSLVEDIARAVGTVAHVVELRRLIVEPFREGALVTMGEIEATAGGGNTALDRLLVPIEAALPLWPAVRLDAAEAVLIRQGQALPGDSGQPVGMVRLYSEERCFLGLGERVVGGRILPRRLMAALPPPAGGQAGL